MSLFDNEEVLTPEILKQHGFELCRSTYIEFFSDTL
jgi:hypothetical protein